MATCCNWLWWRNNHKHILIPVNNPHYTHRASFFNIPEFKKKLYHLLVKIRLVNIFKKIDKKVTLLPAAWCGRHLTNFSLPTTEWTLEITLLWLDLHWWEPSHQHKGSLLLHDQSWPMPLNQTGNLRCKNQPHASVTWHISRSIKWNRSNILKTTRH